jgi:hypothetical protein
MMEWKPHPLLRPPTAEEMAVMEPDKLVELWELYHDAIANAERDAYRYGFQLPIWEEAEKLLGRFNEILVSGGNRCVDAATTYVTNAETLEPVRFDMVHEGMPVFCLDDTTGKIEVGHASAPFVKGFEEMICLGLSNGESVTCTPEHQVFLEDFLEVRAGDLSVGSRLLGLWQRKDDYRSNTQGPCAPAESCKDEGFQSCCRRGPHFCDELPQKEAETGLSASPLPADAHKHTVDWCSRDDVVDGQANSPCGTFDRHRFRESLGQAIQVARKSLPELSQKPYLSPSECSQSQSSTEPLPCPPQSKACMTSGLLCPGVSPEPKHFGSRGLVDGQFQQQKDLHRPIFGRCDSRDVVSCDETIITVIKITSVGKKPVWDLSVSQYGNYLANGIFHHNSSKTSWAAKAVVKAALENPESIIMCFAQNADVSIRQQQSAIYDALPAELRVKTLGVEENVSYTRKNGFSKGSLILPKTHSQIIFKTYAQFLNNDTILEGAELGCRAPEWINIGAWCDEYLIGPELLATLRFRLATRNAKMIVTFTPIDGYTEVVRDYLEGAKTIRSAEAELLNNRMVPVVQESKNRDAGIIYFHSKNNPFGGYERIAKDLKGRPDDEILCRAYGVPTKSKSGQFPLFSYETNVVKHDAIPRKDVTRYMVLDPAGRKNWFMCWIAVDASGTYYVYREWPDVSVGDWARWHQGKWIGAEGSKGLGYGIKTTWT